METIAKIRRAPFVEGQPIKAELVWRRNRQTRREVEGDPFEQITGFHDPRRKHPALGRRSPVAIEHKPA